MSLLANEVEQLLEEAEQDYRNFHRGKVTEDQVENFRFDCNGVKYMAISQPKPHS
jgi:hypothetical protein